MSDEPNYLDELFERALEAWNKGQPLLVDDEVARRPDLSREVRGTLDLVRRVAVQRPPILPEVPGYEVLELLGEGAMGAVYLARHLEVERLVAIKLVGATSWSGKARERLQAEARALGRVRNDHVVAVHEVVHVAGAMGIVMEWVDGANLQEVFQSERSFDRRDAITWPCRVAVQVAEALDAVHREGLIHRDVKPSNILIRRDDTAVLTDFGLVRDAEGANTRLGDFLGTPIYAAPEQLRGDPHELGPWTDVYALGATLYHLVTGHPLHSRECTPLQILSRVESERRAPPRSLNPRIPRDLEIILLKALAARPEKRYSTAREMGEDLQRLLSLTPVLANPPTPAERLVKFCSRNRVILAASVLSAVAALLFSTVLVMRAADVRARVPRAQEHLRRGRLELLNPRDGERFYVVAHGIDAELAEAISDPLHRAIVEYDRALDLDPSLARGWAGEERDTIAVALDVLSGNWRGDDEGAMLSTCIRRYAAARLDPSRTSSVLADCLAATANELRQLGLLSLLVGDAETALAVWDVPRIGFPGFDPLVDAAMGQVLLDREEAGRAYARLLRARDAFPEAGFLTVELADAALQVGDVHVAERLLDEAALLEKLDPFDTLAKVRASLLAVRGDTEAARRAFEEVSARRQQADIHYRFGRFLESTGAVNDRWLAAIEYWRAHRHQPAHAPYREHLAVAARAAWAASDSGHRAHRLLGALEGPQSGQLGLAAVLLPHRLPCNCGFEDSKESATLSQAVASWEPALVVIDSTELVREVLRMRQLIRRLPTTVRRPLARAAVFGDSWLASRSPHLSDVARIGMRATVLGSCMLLATSRSSMSFADTLVEHSGTMDPLTQGWQGVNPAPSGIAVGPYTDGGAQAWFVEDATAAAGHGYRRELSSCELEVAEEDGWILSACLLVDDPDQLDGGVDGTWIGFDTTTRRFDIWFGNDGNGDLQVTLMTSNPTGCGIAGVTKTVLGSGSCQVPGFHHFELEYDPVDGRADLFVDGVLEHSDYAGHATSLDVTPHVSFGAGLSCGDTWAAFHNVKLEVLGAAASQEVVRVGTPPNPLAFLPSMTTPPAVDSIWDPVIDHTNFVTDSVSDFVLITGTGTNIDLGLPGTLLCDVTTPLFLFETAVSPGAPFALVVPDLCNLVGLEICAQGGAVSSTLAVELANALDVTIGAK